MLNLDLPLVLLLTALTGPMSAVGGAAVRTVAPLQRRNLAQAPGLRGSPPQPPPPGLRGRPPAPPPPPRERMEPRRGFVWTEGNYEWRDGRYAWVGGRWETERPGKRWHGGRWDFQGDRYVWIRGEWLDGPGYAAPPAMYVEAPPPAPPPPPQAVQVDVQSRPGFVWIPGNNEWRDGRYVWVEGHWEHERRGHRWQQGHWDHEGDRHYWHPGEWRGDGPGPGPEPGRAYGGGLTIAGRVFGRGGRPLAGITVVLAGTSEGRAVTGPDGRYQFSGLAYGSYAVRPNTGGCNFAPDVVNLNNLGAPVTQDFNAACNW